MLKFKTKDKVIVLKGKDKGKVSSIKKLIKKKFKNTYQKYAILENINISKKHTKGNPNKNKEGGILNIEMPIAISNIMLINPKSNKKEKVKFLHQENKKYRYFKSNKEVLK